MSGQKNKLVENANFIVREFFRIRELSKHDFKLINSDDWAYSVPAASGGSWLIGRAAGESLDDLAREAGKRAGIARNISTIRLRELMQARFSERFLTGKIPITMSSIEKTLSIVGREAKTKCKNKKYLIPCHLMTEDEIGEFNIGPIKFRNRSHTRNYIIEKMKNSDLRGKKESDSRRRAYLRRLLRDGLLYYRDFRWSAEVEIIGCDDEVSRDIADYAVTSALNCMHLLFGASSTDNMRVGGPKLRRDNRAIFSLSPEGSLDVSLSMSGAGQINFASGWSSCFEREDFRKAVELCGVALEASVNPILERPLSRRFLDAAQWYGEAVRDESYSTKVVKYATALERMVITDEKNDIASILADRISAICITRPEIGEREKIIDQVKILYRARSKLVHGSMSPKSPELFRASYLGGMLGRDLLLLIISDFGNVGLREDNFSVSRLSKYYDMRVKFIENLIEESKNTQSDQC
ncbi:HEPN domain-containing protein [Methylobacterium organophilum]|uniref:HEPN domain-containing protein n=2 Tax=Bacteria TaxID=2 RepID=UPI001F13F36F|nr:HEPN domain-containing protein [Methylobacterium organophilum]UMY19758.1 HEPN domain-containing protein [Methylobacterium organophilum]